MNYKNLIFASVFLLCHFTSYSQVKKKTSLPSSRSFSKQKATVPLLLQKAESVSAKDPKEALDYLEQALSMSLKEGDKLGEANTYVVLGNLNVKQKLYAQAINFYSKALILYEKEKQGALLLRTRKQLGEAYENNAAYDNALDQYKKGLKEAEDTKNSSEILAFKNNIANIYKLQGKNEAALDLYKEVLTKEKTQQNKSGERKAYENMGDVYIQQNKVEAAQEVYQSAQESALQDKDQEDISKSYDNIANTYKLKGKPEDELAFRKKKAEFSTKRKDDTALAKDYLEIGALYKTQKNSEQALFYLNKSAAISKDKGFLQLEAESQKAISSVYKEQQNFSKALEHYQLYVQAKDSLLVSREFKINSMISFNDELSVKQKQIDLLEKDMQLLNEEKSFSRLVIYALGIGLLIVLVSAWMVYVNARKRRIANQSLVLRSLRSQMNPHFIFNALNSVNNFISKNDERSANKYLSDFSKLMRTVMENSRYEFISLSTELSILQLYLSLEHARFKDKFDYTLTVSEELSQEQTQIPPMLIQPYIENAIWHGLRYKEEKGLLAVNIQPLGEDLVVSIEDNGIGRKKSAALKTHNQKDKDSIGLKNTEARIAIINELYKTHMRVTIEDLDPATTSGTKVTVYITQTPSTRHEA